MECGQVTATTGAALLSNKFAATAAKYFSISVFPCKQAQIVPQVVFLLEQTHTFYFTSS
jgi:hypothetical protein